MRLSRPRFGAATLVGAALTLTLAISPSLEAADKTEDGKTLIVAPEHESMGTVYYVLNGKPGPNRDQVRFTNEPPKSKAEVDFFTGFSNAIIGYAVAPSGSAEGAVGLVAGEFTLTVESLNTGIKGRDKHVKQKKWLWNKKHPEIAFSIRSVNDVTLQEENDGSKTYSVNIVGDMTIRGETKEVSIPAQMTVMPESEESHQLAPGDLIAIHANYEIVLSEFGVKNGIIGKKVADRIQMDQFLVLTTERPS